MSTSRSPSTAPVRQLFGSRLATVLTMIGVAVGLGNVWRFPYMMGRYGGSAFLFVYLAFVLLFATPALMGEWALGRATRQGPLGALTHAFGKRGRWLAGLLLVGILFAASYYMVVVANVAYAAGVSLLIGFDDDAGMSTYYNGLGRGGLQYAIAVAILVIGLWVLHRGVRAGIEAASKVLVPIFGVVVLYLIITSLRLPGAIDELRIFLRPDWSALTRTSLFAAMGQAFFSLGLGGTLYVAYGSYLQPQQRLPTSAIATAGGDVGAALLAALFIVPSTLALGLDLAAGPGLVFSTLPRLFAAMPGGRLLGTLFLIALLFVAFLSIIAALQVLVATLQDGFGVTLPRALLLVGAVEAILILPTALRPSLIDTLDLLFGSGMQCIGSGIALIALTWALGREQTLTEVFRRTDGLWPSLYFPWIRWVVPAALSVALVLFVLDQLSVMRS